MAGFASGSRRLAWVGAALVGCGGDGGHSHKDAAATAADTAQAEASSDTSSTDASTEASAETAIEVAVSGCSADDLAACEYPSKGLTATVREGLATTDPVTGRVLPLLARIPAVTGPAPVVIWSHGGGFSDDGHHHSEAWGKLLAAHGFVVIHVAHATLNQTTGAKLCELALVPPAECVAGDDEDATGLLAVARALDLAAVLDDLPRLSQVSVNNGGPALDLDHVALSGWSGGSRGPMVLMGATVKPTASAPIFAKTHARVAAAFIMSPTGPGFGGFSADGATSSWDAMRGPFYMATGENDVKPLKPELDGPVRRQPFDEQPGDGKRWLLYSNLDVGVGGHATFNLEDTGSSDARLARLTKSIGSVARAFLDSSLRGDADAAAWLARDDAKILAGDVEWSHR